jgi:hypothetical protein
MLIICEANTFKLYTKSSSMKNLFCCQAKKDGRDFLMLELGIIWLRAGLFSGFWEHDLYSWK